MPLPEANERRSRDSIVRNYDAANASRARNARMKSLDSMREKANKQPARPLTTQESHERTLKSQAEYEHARAARRSSLNKSGDRELIDGRGSIDSRAFNEKHELVGYTINRSDRHNPTIDSIENSRWSSRAGQGFTESSLPSVRRHNRGNKSPDLRSLSDTISGRSDYAPKAKEPLPLPVKLLGIIIVVLLIVLIVLLFVL